MSRRFIAAVVGAALTVTAFGTAPARADEDLLRALAAIAGIVVVGKVISDRLEDEKDRRNSVYRNRFDDRYVYDFPRDSRIIRRIEPQPLPQDVRRRLLPGDCLRSWRTQNERARVFDKNCLKKNYSYTNSLPRACELKVRVKNKNRRGYDVRCLRRNGYQLARR